MMTMVAVSSVVRVRLLGRLNQPVMVRAPPMAAGMVARARVMWGLRRGWVCLFGGLLSSGPVPELPPVLPPPGPEPPEVPGRFGRARRGGIMMASPLAW
jgi:hypothetical protein